MKAWTEGTTALEVYRAKSGWIVRRRMFDSRMAGEDVAGLSDDEGLGEWFYEQLGLISPREGAEIAARVRAVEPLPTDKLIIEYKGMLADAVHELDERDRQVRLINEALTPFLDAATAAATRPDFIDGDDRLSFSYHDSADDEGFSVSVTFDQLGALLTAAGLTIPETPNSNRQNRDAQPEASDQGLSASAADSASQDNPEDPL